CLLLPLLGSSVASIRFNSSTCSLIGSCSAATACNPRSIQPWSLRNCFCARPLFSRPGSSGATHGPPPAPRPYVNPARAAAPPAPPANRKPRGRRLPPALCVGTAPPAKQVSPPPPPALAGAGLARGLAPGGRTARSAPGGRGAGHRLPRGGLARRSRILAPPAL